MKNESASDPNGSKRIYQMQQQNIAFGENYFA